MGQYQLLETVITSDKSCMHIKLQTPDLKREFHLIANKGVSKYSGKRVWFSYIHENGGEILNPPSTSLKQKVITIARQLILKYIKDEQAKETMA